MTLLPNDEHSCRSVEDENLVTLVPGSIREERRWDFRASQRKAEQYSLSGFAGFCGAGRTSHIPSGICPLPPSSSGSSLLRRPPSPEPGLGSGGRCCHSWCCDSTTLKLQNFASASDVEFGRNFRRSLRKGIRTLEH